MSTYRGKFFLYFLIVFLSSSLLFSCSDDDKYSSDNNLRLAFSADTVRFDTVFTTIGSATKTLKVYNRNSDGIRFTDISLVSGGKKGFSLNVDGFSGSSISDVSILKNDSIHIFISVTVDPLQQNTPLLITDSIRFRFNGVSQYVALEAIGQDAILWNNKKITADTTLTAGKPYLIYGGLSVAKGATLNIKEGVSLFFHAKAGLTIDGKINAVGTIKSPIVMRGDRLDNLFDKPKVPYDRMHGQWDGIKISADSYDNYFENVRIRNGVYGILFHASNTSQQKATILNTTIQNTTREALLAINSKITMANSLVANAGKSSVRLIGGDYSFIQSTIVNYMSSYWGFLRGPAFMLSNTGLDENNNTVNFALTNATFGNTIVAGSSSTELRLQESNSLAFNYVFRNCLIRNNGSDDTNFVNTVWGVDPLFKYIYTPESAASLPDNYYYYNFELTKDSPARMKGARVYAEEYPFDILGVSRLSVNLPDIGCYQFTASEN